MDAIALGMDKCFAETANCPKGCSETFKAHMEECDPDHLLYHVPSTKDNRQDVFCMCARPACMNRPYCIEFLDKKLRAHKKQKMFQDNVFVILSSLATTSMFRMLIITDMVIVMPTRWFAGNSHELEEHGWSVLSMGRFQDALHDSMKELRTCPSNI